MSAVPVHTYTPGERIEYRFALATPYGSVGSVTIPGRVYAVTTGRKPRVRLQLDNGMEFETSASDASLMPAPHRTEEVA